MMKNAKKILERKRKIIVVLVVMVSFVSVLAWYQMKKAHAYQSYNTGGNKHFKEWTFNSEHQWTKWEKRIV